MRGTLIDAGVVMAALGSGPFHSSAVKALSEARRAREIIAIPSIAYAEALVGALRHGIQAHSIYRQFFTRVPIEVIPASSSVAEHAARLRVAHEVDLSLADAIVIATAFAAEMSRLVTTDRPWPSATELAAPFEIVHLTADSSSSPTVASGR